MSPRERAAAQEEEEVGGGGKKEAAAYIPADIYEEILYRLSCTRLLELRFVCKDWLRLISCPKFIRKHLERSKAASGCNGTRILTLSSLGKIQEYRYAGGKINNVMSKANLRRGELRILGSCDGLVLFKVGRYNKIALMNPCTGMTEIRDDLLVTSNIICSWFGHHPSTREYVVVLSSEEKVNEGLIRLVFQVYCLSGNRTINIVSVEKLHQFMSLSFQCIGTFLHGRLHFPVFCLSGDVNGRCAISGFDFESNGIFTMRAPTQSYFKLGVVEGCLISTTVKNGPLSSILEMWIMKEEHWTKFANINVGYMVFLNSNPIAYFPNGDVIFEGDEISAQHKIVSLYSLKDMKTSFKAYYNNNKCEVTACVESLVTPAMVLRG